MKLRNNETAKQRKGDRKLSKGNTKVRNNFNEWAKLRMVNMKE